MPQLSKLCGDEKILAVRFCRFNQMFPKHFQFLLSDKKVPLRKEMLAKKQQALREEIAELEKSMDYIDWKQNFYDEVLSGKRPYVSNLIASDEN